jgi:DnaJ-class molecular chaperone
LQRKRIDIHHYSSKENDEYGIEDCPLCEGTGVLKLPIYGRKDCPACKAVGKNKLKKPYVECRKCGGKGYTDRNLMGEKNVCPKCNGKGYIEM